LRNERIVWLRHVALNRRSRAQNCAMIAIFVGSMSADAWPIFGNSTSSGRGPRWVTSWEIGVAARQNAAHAATERDA